MSKKICPKCGSSSISKDAVARWDEIANDWTLAGVHDCETCDDCGAEGDWLTDAADAAPVDDFTKYRELPTVPPFELAVWTDGKLTPATPGKALWSRKDGTAPPAIGDRIRITMNSCGPAVVTGYFVQDGWLGVRCTLLDPPAWHQRQNNGVTTNGHVFGPEFELAGASAERAEQVEA